MRVCVAIFVLFGLVLPASAQLSPAQHTLLVDKVRELTHQHIAYSENWVPPQSQEAWMMDCSNTARYIYWSVFGIKLPRVASDQYYDLKLAGKITYAPRFADGKVDRDALLAQLRSGDLLFWEWTYDIDRRPPITHVMIYLGRTADGTPKMVGSATRARGELTRSGGVDIYEFDPNANMGGVKNFWGDTVRRAQFVGFGRVFKQESSANTIPQLAMNPPRAIPVNSTEIR
ncbi:MAG: NlpC/P60 family protein [Methylacidiphilales bacterium]|nr:NlpC/P60 family protein [Candidatus Methylacidiphilales bacterium]